VTNTFTTTGVPLGAPRIERLVPVHGEITRNVRLQGTGFSPILASNEVTFAGAYGTRVPAEIELQTNGALYVSVPREAISGPVRLTVNGQPANDFSFFVRFHPEATLVFDSFAANTPARPRFRHQQPRDEAETIGEVPIETVIATLDQGRLALAGVNTNQQVGVITNNSYYSASQGYAAIFYKGQESAAPNRHVFQVSSSADSSTVLLRIYALDDPDGSGVTFQIVSVFLPFNAGVSWDYQFTSPIYRPPALPGTDEAIQVEAVSQQWMSFPGREMRRIQNYLRKVQ
jgi:hypothetical protein